MNQVMPPDREATKIAATCETFRRSTVSLQTVDQLQNRLSHDVISEELGFGIFGQVSIHRYFTKDLSAPRYPHRGESDHQ